ncbi:MAG: RpiR family transcriptional regulator [Acidimicrobiales bacterium]|nr:RpiR family transcriptional regulator [Acidimicrobiales bacterium]
MGRRLARVTTATERKVAEYLLQAGARAAAMSAQEIAAAVGTSDATVVRTAKTLGYPSLRDLRRALATEVDDADLASRLDATLSSGGAGADLLATSAERHMQALDGMLQRITPDRFQSAVTLLRGATHTWWCGTGPSAHLAGYAAFLSRRLGRPSGAFTHSGTGHADELLSVADGHAVVVLAYGRLHPYTRVLLRRATQVGARTVLVTDTVGHKLATPVDVELDAGRGTPGLFASHATTIVLLEALVLGVAAADPERADGALATLNDLRSQLAGKRLDVDPS